MLLLLFRVDGMDGGRRGRERGGRGERERGREKGREREGEGRDSERNCMDT